MWFQETAFYGICGIIFSWYEKRRNIDQGQMTGAVFIDFRKAFDTANHSLLLFVLYVKDLPTVAL